MNLIKSGNGHAAGKADCHKMKPHQLHRKITHSHIRRRCERRRAIMFFFPTTQHVKPQMIPTRAHTHTPTHSARQCTNTQTHTLTTNTETHTQRKAPKRKERRSWIVRWARESPPFLNSWFNPHVFFFPLPILLPSPLPRALQGRGDFFSLHKRQCPIYCRSLKRKLNVNMQMCYLERKKKKEAVAQK